MATPMTAVQIVRQFDKWTVDYNELTGWRNHERDDETGKPFGGVYGIGIHHTGDDAPDYLDRKVIWGGRTGLPGPLAQFGGNDNGVIDLHSAGRANHFGGGDPRVLQQVMNESYGKYPSPSRYHEGSQGAADGNDHFYGIENYYSGKHRMTGPQYRSMILVCAAICDFYDWTEKSVIGHKEWSSWKVDPQSHDMAVIRLDVKERLRLGPPGKSKPAPAPKPAEKVTQVSKFGDALDAAIRIGREVPANREVAVDVLQKVKLQRARLPEG